MVAPGVTDDSRPWSFPEPAKELRERQPAVEEESDQALQSGSSYTWRESNT